MFWGLWITGDADGRQEGDGNQAGTDVRTQASVLPGPDPDAPEVATPCPTATIGSFLPSPPSAGAWPSIQINPANHLMPHFAHI